MERNLNEKSSGRGKEQTILCIDHSRPLSNPPALSAEGAQTEVGSRPFG